MAEAIPQLVYRMAEKTLVEFCSHPIERSGHDYFVAIDTCADGFELQAGKGVGGLKIRLARVLYSNELEQWTIHRPRTEGRWSYVPEAGGSLDLARLLRYLKEDPLNIFW